MFKRLIPSPDTTPQQARNAFWVLLVFPIAYITVFAMYLFLFIRTGAWQLQILTFAVAVLAVNGIIAVFVNRAGNRGLAGILDITAMALILPVTSMLLSGGIGLVLGIITIVVSSLVSGMLLSGKYITRAVIVGIVSGLASILLDLFWPFSRFNSPTLNIFVPVIAVLSVIVFAILIARNFRDYSLRTKLLVAMLNVAFIVMLTFGFVAYVTSRNRILTDVGALLQSNANAQALIIGSYIDEHIDTLSILTAQFKNAITDANAAYTGNTTEIQSEIARLDEQWIAADQAGNDLDPLVASRLNNDAASILKEYRQSFPENAEVFITDRYGAVVAATNRLSDLYQADEAWWQTAYNNGIGNVYVGNMEYDESSQTFATNIAIPIMTPDSAQVAGVLRTTLTMESLLEVLYAQAKTVEGSHTDVLFPNGKIVDEEDVEDVSPELQASIRAAARPYDELTLHDIQAFASVATIQSDDNPSVDEAGWLVIFHQEREVALAPVNAQLRTMIILGLVVAGLAAGTAFLLARFLSAPITALTSAAQKLAAGDLAVEAKGESRDEVGQLAGAFNAMTRQLRELIGTLEQRVADRTKALSTSTEVSRRLSTILDRDKLVKEVVEQLVTAFGYYYAHIYLLDEAKETLVMVGGTGEAGQTMLARGHTIPKGRGLVGRAAETNAIVLVSDTSKEADWLPNELLPETKAEIAVPISIGDEVLGVFDVQHNIVNGLTEQDADVLQSIANQVSVALQNTRQYENTQKIAADMSVVANVGIATSTITESGHLLQEVVDLSKRSFNLYHAHIYLLNEAGDTLELSAGAGEVGRQMVAEKRSIPLGSQQSLVARAARTQEGVVVNNVTAAPDFLPNLLLPNTRSEMAVPMIVAGKVIGVLDVQSEIANRFTDVDVSIQTTLASQVAVAFQNARSFSQTQHQAERETAVNLITQKIQNTTSVEAALKTAVRELGHKLGMKPTLVTLEPGASRINVKETLMTNQQNSPGESEVMKTGVSK